jgi:hypothetical protein
MVGFLLLAVLVSAQERDFKAEIDALRPASHVWREIAWKSCPLEALTEAREKNKPVIFWVYLGDPSGDDRC